MWIASFSYINTTDISGKNSPIKVLVCMGIYESHMVWFSTYMYVLMVGRLLHTRGLISNWECGYRCEVEVKVTWQTKSKGSTWNTCNMQLYITNCQSPTVIGRACRAKLLQSVVMTMNVCSLALVCDSKTINPVNNSHN